jgi:hypothetical protein
MYTHPHSVTDCGKVTHWINTESSVSGLWGIGSIGTQVSCVLYLPRYRFPRCASTCPKVDSVCDQYIELFNYLINHSRIGNHFSISASRGSIVLIDAQSQTALGIWVITHGSSMSFVINSQVKAKRSICYIRSTISEPGLPELFCFYYWVRN